ncbi:MAG TPA: alpha/beta fold hydrolase [Gammaproteobacteria bacterium]|nr:alpha/beta fold hydrolase [Gammaproteobacteria bacterium]
MTWREQSPFDTAGFERWEYRIGGVKTVAYTIGEGPPVLYWHGGGTWHGFAWTRAWADRFKVIVPYHPGFGESGDDPEISSMDDYVAHYIELCDAMGLRSFALVGTSLGGFMAAAFAVAHPGRVAKLVLVCPAGISSPDFPMANFAATPHDEFPRLFVHDLAVIEPFWPDRFDERGEHELQYAAKGFAPSSVSGAKLVRRARRITMPTLVIWGDKDRVLPAGLAPLWGEAIPQATVRIVKNAGHLLLDESAEARDAVKAFLS